MYRTFVALAVLSVGLPASAETNLSDMGVSQLVQACALAMDDGLPIDEIAGELVGRTGFNLGQENAAKGEACLKTATGFDFELRGGSFVSDELEANIQQSLEDKERLREMREAHYLSLTYDICKEKFAVDQFTALTTPICAELFKVNGLP